MKQAFDYFRDAANFSSLEVMKLNQQQSLNDSSVKLKVAEVVNGFTAFGFSAEATQLHAFLRGIGDIAGPNNEWVFTPAQIVDYERMIEKKNYMQDKSYVQFFFKSMSSDGKVVTIQDIKKVLKEFKMDDSLAEEYVERTAGMSKAKYFTLD